MVSKNLKKTPTKSIRDRRSSSCRRQRRKSPTKVDGVATSSTVFSSINKTFHSCKRRLAKIFSKLARISTPNSRYKGYRTLKKKKKFKGQTEEIEQPESEKQSICRVLFFNEQQLPPLISPTKKTIFLDLDETLVHSKADPPPQMFDFIVRPKIDGEIMNFYVLKRPGVDAFLESLAAKYELVVFTAGLKEYASLVLDKLDSKGLISHRLYRDSCKQVDGKYVKDLSEMGRDLKRTVIVDDNPNCYSFQPGNAVPIRSFIDDMEDGELGKLVSFFEECESFEDIRDAVKELVCRRDDDIKN